MSVLDPRSILGLTLGRFRAEERRVIALLCIHRGRTDWKSFHDLVDGNSRHPNLYRALAALRADGVVEPHPAVPERFRLADPDFWHGRLDAAAVAILRRADRMGGCQVHAAGDIVAEKPRLRRASLSGKSPDSPPRRAAAKAPPAPAPTANPGYDRLASAAAIVFDAAVGHELARRRGALAREFGEDPDMLLRALWAAMVLPVRPSSPIGYLIATARGFRDKGVPVKFRGTIPAWHSQGVRPSDIGRPAYFSADDVTPTGENRDRAIRGDLLRESWDKLAPALKLGRFPGAASRSDR